jgi:DNA-directed RNA polymerase specialized sigma24 family protein
VSVPGGDAALINAIRSGDPGAYDVLRTRHRAAARRLAGHLDRGPATVDEVVDLAFAQVLEAIRRGGGPTDAFRPYLLTTVQRAAREAAGAGAPIPTDDQDIPDPGQLAPAAPAPAAGPAVAAFMSLPERWRAVLWHTEIEGAAPAAVASLFGLDAAEAADLAERARDGMAQSAGVEPGEVHAVLRDAVAPAVLGGGAAGYLDDADYSSPGPEDEVATGPQAATAAGAGAGGAGAGGALLGAPVADAGVTERGTTAGAAEAARRPGAAGAAAAGAAAIAGAAAGTAALSANAAGTSAGAAAGAGAGAEAAGTSAGAAAGAGAGAEAAGTSAGAAEGTTAGAGAGGTATGTGAAGTTTGAGAGGTGAAGASAAGPAAAGAAGAAAASGSTAGIGMVELAAQAAGAQAAAAAGGGAAGGAGPGAGSHRAGPAGWLGAIGISAAGWWRAASSRQRNVVTGAAVVLVVAAIVGLALTLSSGGTPAATRSSQPTVSPSTAAPVTSSPPTTPATVTPTTTPASVPPAVVINNAPPSQAQPVPGRPRLAASLQVTAPAPSSYLATVSFSVTDTGGAATRSVTARLTTLSGTLSPVRAGRVDGWNCSVLAGTATCSRGPLPAGASAGESFTMELGSPSSCGQSVQLTVISGALVKQAAATVPCDRADQADQAGAATLSAEQQLIRAQPVITLDSAPQAAAGPVAVRPAVWAGQRWHPWWLRGWRWR